MAEIKFEIIKNITLVCQQCGNGLTRIHGSAPTKTDDKVATMRAAGFYPGQYSIDRRFAALNRGEMPVNVLAGKAVFHCPLGIAPRYHQCPRAHGRGQRRQIPARAFPENDSGCCCKLKGEGQFHHNISIRFRQVSKDQGQDQISRYSPRFASSLKRRRASPVHSRPQCLVQRYH